MKPIHGSHAIKAPQSTGSSKRLLLLKSTPENYSEFYRQCRARAEDYKNSREHLVLCINVDNLKQINDNIGHTAGDRYIDRIWRILIQICPSRAVTFRAGGDEFIVYCNFDRLKDAATFATKLSIELNNAHKLESNFQLLNCSLGGSQSNSKKFDLLSLIDEANTALIWAKQNGKKQLKYYDFQECNAIKFERQLTADFSAALTASELSVYFQPIYGVENRKILGAEALIRWKHPSGIDIPASTIISIAAQAGKLGNLGKYVLTKACNFATLWPREMFVSVNLTAADFHRGDLYEMVMSVLTSSGLEKSRLRIEITESENLEITSKVKETIERLQSSGILVGVDDFGTGYSSMGSIDKFPADFVKIDRSLIENCDNRPSSRIFLSAIRLISEKIGMKVIAEGVETLGELAVVSSAGIAMVQGYYYSKAISKEKMLCLLDSKR